MPMLSTQEAKRFYDRFGAKQDRQVWYEASALRDLAAHANLPDADAVFEFGCGTGRFAADILTRHLSASATYRGVDLSETMIGLASERLAPFADRASVTLSSGEPAVPLPSGSVDRFLSTYVLDLLPSNHIEEILREARRVLKPNGLLCLAGITPGTTVISRIVMTLWQMVHSLSPTRVGGCRPVRTAEYLNHSDWELLHHRVIVIKGLASEVLVARSSSTDA